MKIKNFELAHAKKEDEDYFLSCMKRNLLLSVSETERKFSDTWINDTLSIAKNSFEKKPMCDEIFILRNGNENVGFLWLAHSKDQFTAEDIGYLLGIYVEEKHRDNGIGKELMKFSEEWCEDNGLLALSLNVGSENTNAQKFYERCGFGNQSSVMRKLLR